MKKVVKVWNIIRKPVCTVVFFLCLFLLLGCTGTADNGGSLIEYTIHGCCLLGIMCAALVIGRLYEDEDSEDE